MSSKIRVIVNGVSFYSSKAQIVRGVGDNTDINLVVQRAYETCVRDKVLGFGSTFTLYDHKMQTKKYDVQINL